MWHLVVDLSLKADSDRIESLLRGLAISGHPINGLDEAVAAGFTFRIRRQEPDGTWVTLEPGLGFEDAVSRWHGIVEGKDDPGGEVIIEPEFD